MKPFLKVPLVITSPWGWRNHPISGVRHFHDGVDLRARFEQIYAPENGTIAYTGYDVRSGKFLGFKVSSGKVLEFVHLDKIYVSKGDEIPEGTPIAKTGNTGYSTAPHLHFAIKEWIDGEKNVLDPTPYVKSLWTKQIVLAGIFGIPALILIALGFYYFTK